jgi:adenylylsulfate kinase
MSGVVVWLTGLPRSGKSTLAESARAALERAGTPALILDGDRVREALVPRPGYDPASRESFYATLANLAGLCAAQGFVVLVPATAHRRAWREHARAQAPRFVEVHVTATVEECRARDPAGLYTSAPHDALPGAGVAYEPPEHPDVRADGGHDERALAALLALL